MSEVTPTPWDRVQGLLPPLAAPQRDELKASLETHGYRGPPVYVMPDGRIIDGHNRYDLWGSRCVVEVLDVDEETGLALALAHNTARRQLTTIQINQIRDTQRKTALRLREQGKTQAEAAAAVGVSQQVVSDWQAKSMHNTSGGKVHKPDVRTKVTKDGKEKVVKAVKAGVPQAQVAADLGVNQATVSRIVTEDAKREQEEVERKARAEAAARTLPKDNRIQQTDFRHQAETLADESVALIFTDPPYARDNLDLYAEVARIGSRVLVPGGSLLCYCGQFLVPDIYAAIGKTLRPWWIAAVQHGGQKARMTEYGVVVCWKPLLWFVKGTRVDKHTFVDDLTIGTREKDGHEWQQAESEAAYWIERLTKPGELVWDPFCGSGTTAVAAHKLKRLFLTCDVDERAITTARARFAEVFK